MARCGNFGYFPFFWVSGEQNKLYDFSSLRGLIEPYNFDVESVDNKTANLEIGEMV